jgi:hypothetical protein
MGNNGMLEAMHDSCVMQNSSIQNSCDETSMEKQNNILRQRRPEQNRRTEENFSSLQRSLQVQYHRKSYSWTIWGVRKP